MVNHVRNKIADLVSQDLALQANLDFTGSIKESVFYQGQLVKCQSVSDWAEIIGKNGAWGDSSVIQIYADITGITVHVLSTVNGSTTHYCPKTNYLDEASISIQHSGSHFRIIAPTVFPASIVVSSPTFKESSLITTIILDSKETEDYDLAKHDLPQEDIKMKRRCFVTPFAEAQSPVSSCSQEVVVEQNISTSPVVTHQECGTLVLDQCESDVATVDKKSDQDSALQCVNCGRIFKSLKWLNSHIEQSPCLLKIECNQCGKKYKNLIILKKHMKKIHERGKNECTACKRIFASRESLENHRRHHHTQVQCELCSKSFKNSNTLRTHRNKAHGAKSIKTVSSKENKFSSTKCIICNKLLESKSGFNKHMSVHQTQQSQQDNHFWVCENDIEL